MFRTMSPRPQRSERPGLAALILAICMAAAIAGGPSPAMAQSENGSSSNVGEARNQDSLKRLDKERRSGVEKETELLKQLRETDAGSKEEQAVRTKLEKVRDELHKVRHEIESRTANKDDFVQIIQSDEGDIEATRQARERSKKKIENLFCNKKDTAKWREELKKAEEEHKKNNKRYYDAKKQLKKDMEIASQRFGSGEIQRYREAKEKANREFRRANLRFKFSKSDLRRMFERMRGDKQGTTLEKGADDQYDEDYDDEYDDISSLEFDPERCGDGTLTALTFPDEPQTVRIAVQVPEVCVGTTYYVNEQEIYDEATPRVTDHGDNGEPRDVPRPDVPVASVPKDQPQDSDEPRDVPREETPKEVPVASVPETTDEPRDVPHEETPTENTPDEDTPHTSVPVTSTPEDEPRDVPQDEYEETDLGLVKAVVEIVALAVVDAQTGDKIRKVGVKLLPDTPPLPGGEVIEVSATSEETFDDASFFDDDADGGFTDDDGEIVLASLTTPIGNEAPEAETPEQKELKQKEAELRRQAETESGKLRKLRDGQKLSPEGEKKKAEAKEEARERWLRNVELQGKVDDRGHADQLKPEDLEGQDPDFVKKLKEITKHGGGSCCGGGLKVRDDEHQLQAEFKDKYDRDAQEKIDKIIDEEMSRDPAKKAELETQKKKVEEAKAKLKQTEEARKALNRRIKEAKKKERERQKLPNPGRIDASDQPADTGEVASAQGREAASRSADGKASATRRVSLPVDAEPKDSYVAALQDADAFEAMMADDVVASLATNAFSIGTQPIVQFAVPKQQVDEVKKRVAANNWFSWFKPDPCWSKQEVNDPYFSSKGLWGQKYDDQWAIKRAGFTEEMISTARDNADAEPVTVAVVDTGIDWFHPDLDRKNLWRNEGEIPDNGIDDEGNGYVDDVIGSNFVDKNNEPWDYDGHGTFIAGIIGAASDNSKGIAGVNPNVRLMPLKALDAFGHGHASTAAEAIAYAADNGAKVINLSLGGQGLSPAAALAIDYANSKGALVVVAAGNSATDVSGFGPAGTEGVMTVSATDQRDRRAGFSNWGEEVDISAPGVDVMSLRARNTDLLSVIRGVEYQKGEGIIGDSRAYYRASGTSFAAPIVSGAASLIMSLRPNLDAQAVRRMLLNSARDIEVPGIDNYTGYGLVDVGAALEADPAHNVESRITAAKPVRVDGKSMLQLVGTADADDFDEASLSLGKGKDPEKWLTIRKRIAAPVKDDILMDIPAAAFAGSKEWTIRLITRHKDGTEREARFAVTLG